MTHERRSTEIECPSNKPSTQGKPRLLSVRPELIPAELCKKSRWVMWQLVQRKGRWTKMPKTVNGAAASSTNSATWSTFDEVCDALLMGDGFDGIGLVLGDDVHGIDLDDCRDPVTGDLTDLANEVLEGVQGYAEVSPSGTGIKVFAKTNLDGSRTKKEFGVELYKSGRYFTVTGHRLNGHDHVVEDVQDLGWLVEKVWAEELNPAGDVDADERALGNYKPVLEDWDLNRVINQVLPHMDADCGYDAWLRVGLALHHQGGGDPEWLVAWDNWSAQSGKWADGVCAEKWSTFSEQRDTGRGAVTLASLLKKAKVIKFENSYKTNDGTHLLARYVEIDANPKQPRWVIHGFIGTGVVVIAGAHGVGKTTTILPLAMIAAGLIPSVLAPSQWRHVIYVTEDVEQAIRIITGVVKYSGLDISLSRVKERLHIVTAVRLDPKVVAEVGETYKAQFIREVDGIKVLPLLVMDTKSAVLALDNENDNGMASAMMAEMKQAFGGIPVWLIGHVAKASINRTELNSSRGASAIDADANQTLFLVNEKGKRYLIQGKTRFEPKWKELEITSHTYEVIAPDEFGNWEPLTLRWGIAAPPIINRNDATKQAAELAFVEKDALLQKEIISIVEEAWQQGTPLNKTSVTKQIKRNKSVVVALLDTLLNQGKLHEVEVPSQLRKINSKSHFLVCLTEYEHALYVTNGTIPSAKQIVPPSWRKDHE